MRWACLSLTKEGWTVEGMVEGGGVGEGGLGADLPVASSDGGQRQRRQKGHNKTSRGAHFGTVML